MLVSNNYGHMWNINKTVNHILKLRADQYLFSFHTHQLLFKNLTDLQKIFKENFILAKKPRNDKNLKIQNQQRTAKLKCVLLK